MPPKQTRGALDSGSSGGKAPADPMLAGTYADEAHGHDMDPKAKKAIAAAEREESQRELAQFEANLGGGGVVNHPGRCAGAKKPHTGNMVTLAGAAKNKKVGKTTSAAKQQHPPPMRASFGTDSPGPSASNQRAGQPSRGRQAVVQSPRQKTGVAGDTEEEQERKVERQEDIDEVRRLSLLGHGNDDSSTDDDGEE